MPAVDVAAPAASNRPPCRCEAASRRGASATTAMPIGTLMKKTQRHEATCVITPPRTRPSDEPPIVTAVKMLRARTRSRPSGKLATIAASTAGEAIAPPAPWTARAASSAADEVARPPASDASVKMSKAGHEGLAPAEYVAGPAAQEQQAAEGQSVRVEDPGQAGRRQVQASRHRRQRDVDHCHVQDNHQLGAQHYGEGDVAPVALVRAGNRRYGTDLPRCGQRTAGGRGRGRRRRHGSFPEQC